MQLLEGLDQTVITDLDRHPSIGRRYFARSPQGFRHANRGEQV